MRFAWVFAAALGAAAPGIASAAMPAATAAMPAATAVPAASLWGAWRLDPTSMPIPAAARPASVTVSFAQAPAGEIAATYVITARDGQVRRMTSRARPGGPAVAIEGDRMEADSVALSMPAPGVLVMGLAKDGRPGSVRVYTVAVDGRSMTETAANVGSDGKPFIRTYRWIRTADAR